MLFRSGGEIVVVVGDDILVVVTVDVRLVAGVVVKTEVDFVTGVLVETIVVDVDVHGTLHDGGIGTHFLPSK